MYPLSSKKAKAKNRIKMLGKNSKMPPTPAMMPSTIRELSSGATWSASSPAATPPEIMSSPSWK